MDNENLKDNDFKETATKVCVVDAGAASAIARKIDIL